MRHLPKASQPPPSLAEFIANQLPVGVNLTYDSGFSRKPQLRAELVAEQFGLCGYTGVALDDRLAARQQPAPQFTPHIEHLKPQSQCRSELEATGAVWGSIPGEDLDYHNLIAALHVSGARSEKFGAAYRQNRPLPVWPTHADCESRFTYHLDGRVSGRDSDATQTSELLNLNHPTLKAWRQAALDGYYSPDYELTRAELTTLIAMLNVPEQGRLREFSFVLKSVAESLLLPP